ncbi:hypothetical protein [Desertivirga brevis]|uniref:hypothetical protein n=1 Tax=Desertivirga brevis TaxID=2810310 RepID=UPI001A97C300|nr:hypothetical protein [Pedobacter sp. SYSU D00873]
MKNKKLFFQILVGPLTGAVVALFLSGKIIHYPQGTKEGGIIGAVAVAIIMLTSWILSMLTAYIKKKRRFRDLLWARSERHQQPACH